MSDFTSKPQAEGGAPMSEHTSKMEWTGIMLEIDGIAVAYPVGNEGEMNDGLLMREIAAAWNTRPQHRAVAAILAEITQHLEDVVETAKNGDANNWNGYYLPKFAELSKQARQALRDAGERP